MWLKDHEQKSSWPLSRSSKRAQRCLSFAILFIIILVLFTSHHSFPRKSELKLTKTRPYTYGSSPEAGRPILPFEDNSVRKSTENPFFNVQYEDEYEYDEVQEQQPIQPRDLETKEVLSREELKGR